LNSIDALKLVALHTTLPKSQSTRIELNEQKQKTGVNSSQSDSNTRREQRVERMDIEGQTMLEVRAWRLQMIQLLQDIHLPVTEIGHGKRANTKQVSHIEQERETDSLEQKAVIL
jgi:hypothetical protein